MEFGSETNAAEPCAGPRAAAANTDLAAAPALAGRARRGRGPPGGGSPRGGPSLPKVLWNRTLRQLSSLPLAIGELAVIAVLSSLGTIIEQGKPLEFYMQARVVAAAGLTCLVQAWCHNRLFCWAWLAVARMAWPQKCSASLWHCRLRFWSLISIPCACLTCRRELKLRAALDKGSRLGFAYHKVELLICASSLTIMAGCQLPAR